MQDHRFSRDIVEQAQELQRAFDEALRENADLQAMVRSLQRERLQNLAGTHVEEMLKSLDSTASYLRHPEAKIRLAALILIDSHWSPTDAYAGDCERMAFEDPDLEVRREALANLGTYYRGSDDARVGKRLASLVRNESASAGCRTMAYLSLFEIRGIDPSPYMDAAQGKFSFPHDVDWSFVDSFLSVNL